MGKSDISTQLVILRKAVLDVQSFNLVTLVYEIGNWIPFPVHGEVFTVFHTDNSCKPVC